MIRGFELVIRRFELVTHGFELVTRGFELVTRGFELALLNFSSCFKAFNSQLVTRNSYFTISHFQKFQCVNMILRPIFFKKNNLLEKKLKLFCIPFF